MGSILPNVNPLDVEEVELLRSYLNFTHDVKQLRVSHGGGGDRPPSQHFWLMDPKIFLKAPLAPIYTNFEGEECGLNFAKGSKTLFSAGFFKNAIKSTPPLEKILDLTLMLKIFSSG